MLWNSLGMLLRPQPPRAAQLERLGHLLDLGLPPDQALSMTLPQGLPARPEGGPVVPCLAALDLLGPGEAGFLAAAEGVGGLPAALKALAGEIQEQHQGLRALLARAAYPILVLHLALLPLQIPRLLSQGFGPALLAAGLWLIALDLSLLGLFWAARNAARRGTLEGWPLLGPLYRARQRRRALFLLTELHASGLLWGEAFERAARALEAPRLASKLHAASKHIATNGSPAQLLGEALDLPSALRARLLSGEAVGDLEPSLRQCRKELDLRLLARQEWLARGLGAGLYALAVGVTVLVLLRALLAIYAPLR